MRIKAVLFDLDGTLLPMNHTDFGKGYYSALAALMAEKGHNPKEFLSNLNSGIKAMLLNDGSKTNEEAFWEALTSIYGEDFRQNEAVFQDFYKNEFRSLEQFTAKNPYSLKILDLCRKKGFKLALATNPVFPPIAIETRLSWNGMTKDCFEFITTYDNSHFCKPSAGYYLEIAERLGVKPEECLMVGNDVSDDMPSSDIGMSVFLLTDCLLNAKPEDLSRYPSGGFNELYSFINDL